MTQIKLSPMTPVRNHADSSAEAEIPVYCFNLSYNNLGVNYNSQSTAAIFNTALRDLVLGFGAFSVEFDLGVRYAHYQENGESGIVMNLGYSGEILDAFDFDYGDDFFLDFGELISDGAVVQLGYEKEQPDLSRGQQGTVFFTHIPFSYHQTFERSLP